MAVKQVIGGMFRAAGRGAVEAGKQYVRSSVRDFLSGGQGEDKAIERGNKSAIMAREMREAEYDRQIAEQQVKYQDERYAPLDSGDEFLDEVYSKLGDIDDKMGKMLDHFVAQDKRADKQAILDRQANLSRKLGKEENETTVSGGGGGGSSGGSSSESEGGGSSGGGGSQDFVDGLLDSVLGVGGQSVTDYLTQKALDRAAKTRFGKWTTNTLNKGKNLARGALKPGNIARGVGAGFTLSGLYQMGTAGSSAQQFVEGANTDFLKNQYVQLPDGSIVNANTILEGSSAVAGKGLKNEQLIQGGMDTALGAGLLAGGPHGWAVAAGIGSLKLGLKLGEMLWGTSLEDMIHKEAFEDLNLKKEDLDNAKFLAEHGENALWQKLKQQDLPPELVEQLVEKAKITEGSLFTGFGNELAPSTWPVSWAGALGGGGSSEDFRKGKHTQEKAHLYRAALKIFEGVVLDAKEKYKPPQTLEEYYQEQKDGKIADAFTNYIQKNKLDIGIRPLYWGDTQEKIEGLTLFKFSPTASAKDLPDKYKDILSAQGFKRIKGREKSGYIFVDPEAAVESSILAQAKKRGVTFAKHDYYREIRKPEHFLIQKDVPPEFLANGAILESATSLGTIEADAINSLENSGNQIKDVIKDGFDGMNDEWFDDALMGYFMDSVLPGLVGALKTENKNLGIATPVSVFG